MRLTHRAIFPTAIFMLAASTAFAPVAFGHPDSDDNYHHDDQHGSDGGHLPASSKNVNLIGKIDNLTSVDGGISDVAAFRKHAYLGAFHPECTGRNAAGQGGGVHVVDMRDPENPVKVAWIPAHPNSYVGEGVHVFHMSTAAFTGDVLVHNNETCDGNQFAPSGVSIWDVTNPASPKPLTLNFGDAVPAMPRQTYHTTHSVQGWSTGSNAYVALQDNQDLKDVDIVDITDPRNPVLISERGLEDWPGAYGSYANGETVNHHDMQV